MMRVWREVLRFKESGKIKVFSLFLSHTFVERIN